MLRVKKIALYDRIVIEGNEVDLLWTVSGCHMIKIEDVGLFKGNLHGIRFKMEDISKPIKVSFYGIAKKEHRTIPINGYKVNLLNKFYTEPEMPVAYLTPQFERKLESQFANSKLRNNIKEINFEFDSFELNNYKT